MDEELDLVVISDDEGNEQTMEVLDYFFYEGEEYAILVQYSEDDDELECECGEEDCDCCKEEQQDAYIMRVCPVGEDQEEFVPVDEDMLQKLVEFVQNDLYADEEDDFFEDDDEDDEDDDDDDDDIFEDEEEDDE